MQNLTFVYIYREKKSISYFMMSCKNIVLKIFSYFWAGSLWLYKKYCAKYVLERFRVIDGDCSSNAIVFSVAASNTITFNPDGRQKLRGGGETNCIKMIDIDDTCYGFFFFFSIPLISNKFLFRFCTLKVIVDRDQRKRMFLVRI